MIIFPMERILVTHASVRSCNWKKQQLPFSLCKSLVFIIIVITHSSVGRQAGPMGGHQSTFDPPPEGSTKCSLDLRAQSSAWLPGGAAAASHPTYDFTSKLYFLVLSTLTTLCTDKIKQEKKTLIVADVTGAQQIDCVFCIPDAYGTI